jgi:hypothetical protein
MTTVSSVARDVPPPDRGVGPRRGIELAFDQCDRIFV